MKKNLTFKLGLFCVALVLVSTCFITNAWARYTSTVTATDTARVAKFDVTFKNGTTKIENNAQINIFDTSLKNIKQDENEKNVNTEKLVAPGSNGSFQIVVTNKSEVSVKITIGGELVDASGNKLSGDATPIKFCVKADGSSLSDSDTFTDLNQIGSFDIDVNNTDNTDKTYTVYWKWVTTDDASDTKFGTAENLLKLTAKITLTAEQILPTEN